MHNPTPSDLASNAIKIDQINDLLPQTQCGQCGFKGCLPYATAIAEGRAEINQCPPGGESGIAELAALLGVTAMPLNTHFGVHKPAQVAYIIEQNCIGCVKCIEACPVDAIVGAAKLMHTVIVSECTGCGLCIAPCPVDCIEMQDLPDSLSKTDKKQKSAQAKQRYEAKNARKVKILAEKNALAKIKKAELAEKILKMREQTITK